MLINCHVPPRMQIGLPALPSAKRREGNSWICAGRSAGGDPVHTCGSGATWRRSRCLAVQSSAVLLGGESDYPTDRECHLEQRSNLSVHFVLPNELPKIESDPPKLSVWSMETHNTAIIGGDSNHLKSETVQFLNKYSLFLIIAE